MDDLNARELRRCLINLDVDGMRRLWSAHYSTAPQPTENDDTLYAMHMARTMMTDISPDLLQYSQEWLEERRPKQKFVYAVGVAVGALSPLNQAMANDMRDEMSASVEASYKEGLDLDKDAVEVKARMMVAQRRVSRRYSM